MANRVCRLALTAALLVMAARYTVRVFDLSSKDYGEGPILAMVQRMQREPVSAAWLRGPEYTLSCYGPGYYWSVIGAAAVLPGGPSLIPGRLVALAAALATAGLIAFAVGRKVRSVEIGLFSGLLYLVSSVVFSWVPYQRVDALAVLFGVGAYVAADLGRRGFLASAILVAAGSLVKQTVALTAIPVLVYLVLGKRYRDASVYAVLVCVLGAGLWGAVNYRSGGFFLTAAIQANLNPADLGHAGQLAVGFIQCPTALIGLIVVAWLLNNEPAKAIRCVYCLGFVLGTLIAVAAACKQGASINYYLQPCALAATVIGLHGVPRVDPSHRDRMLVGLGLLSLVLVVPGLGDFPAQRRPVRRDPTVHPQVERLLAAAGPSCVLADGRWVDVALSAGAKPLVNDPFVFRLMVDNGTLSATGLIDAMQQGKVRLLLLSRSIEAHRRGIGHSAGRWPAEVLDAMQQYYQFVTEEGGIYIYQHRSAKTAGPNAH